MQSVQLKLLKELATRIRTEKKNPKKVIHSLQSAKILTGKGDFTTNYSHLKKAVVAKKDKTK